jgi:hypothetical protein
VILLLLLLLFGVWPVVVALVDIAWAALRVAAALVVLVACVTCAVAVLGVDCTVALIAWRRERRRRSAVGTGMPNRPALATAPHGGVRAATPPEPPADPPWLNEDRVRTGPWLGGWLHPAYQDGWRRLRRRRRRARTRTISG